MKKSILNTAVLSLFGATTIFAQTKGDGNLLTTIEVFAPTCSNNNNGYIHINTNPEAGPQTIIWNNNANTMALDNLSVGTYIYTLTNSYGQSITDTIVLTAPNPVQIDATIVNPTSGSLQNGSITINNLNSSNCTFHWSSQNGAGLNTNSLDQNALGVGTYKLIAGLNDACVSVKEFTLTATPAVLSTPATGVSGSQIMINNQHHNILAGSSPFKGKAHITTGEGTESVEIYNQRGEQIRIPELEMNNSVQTIDLESGSYIVRFNLLDGTKESRHLIVE